MVSRRFLKTQIKLQHAISGRPVRRLAGCFLHPADQQLLARLTAPQTYQAVECAARGEIFIHWFYCEREGELMTPCERFHLNMLLHFNVPNRVKAIHLRCAARGEVTDAMRNMVRALSAGHATVDFRMVEPKACWELETFQEAVEYALQTGDFVYYAHFKGVSRFAGASRSQAFSSDLDICFWSYLMYSALFEAPEDAKAVGPLPHRGITKSYMSKDISWSCIPDRERAFHYSGSFQAFSGQHLRACLEARGLGTPEKRQALLWAGDPYTVEMFLSLVVPQQDVWSLSTADYKSTWGMYTVYSSHHFQSYRERFVQLFKE